MPKRKTQKTSSKKPKTSSKRPKTSKNTKAGCFSCEKCDECMRLAVENYLKSERRDSNFNNYPLRPPSPKTMERPGSTIIPKPFPRTRMRHKVHKAGMPTQTTRRRRRGGIRGQKSKEKILKKMMLTENTPATNNSRRSLKHIPPQLVYPISNLLNYDSSRALRSTSKTGKNMSKWRDEFNDAPEVRFMENEQGEHIFADEFGCIGCELGIDNRLMHSSRCRSER
tara:strand:- start:1585 stop:2259 length:675 start_codon:yes stop_codon:yes gene_type:complete